MREKLMAETKAAMKAGDKVRLGTLRLISAAIKDRDIAARVDTSGSATGSVSVGEDEILQLLQKMVKQRRESIATFETAGRAELAAAETAEIAVIEEFLPQQMSDDAVADAVAAVIAEVGATGPKDMGAVMAALKQEYAGQMDFGKASAAAKAKLTG